MDIKTQLKAHKQITGQTLESNENTPEEISASINSYLEQNNDVPNCGVENLSKASVALLTEMNYIVDQEAGTLTYSGDFVEDEVIEVIEEEEAPIVNKIKKSAVDADGKVKSIKDITGKKHVGDELVENDEEVKSKKPKKIKEPKEPKPTKVREPREPRGSSWYPNDNGDRQQIIVKTKVDRLEFRNSRVSFWIGTTRVAKLQDGRLYYCRVENPSVPVSSNTELIDALNAVDITYGTIIGAQVPKPQKPKDQQEAPKAQEAQKPKKPKKVEEVIEEEVIEEEVIEEVEEEVVEGEEDFDFGDE